jgi:multiple sugar transport system permease protein
VTAVRGALDRWAGPVFVAPAVLFFTVYTLYPVLRALYLSFTRYLFASIEPPVFVGLNNYISALQDPKVIGGLGKALWFTVLFYPGAIILPLAVALVLDRVQSPRLGGLYRVLLYVPAIIPSPLIFALWRWMYAPSTGLANFLIVDTLHLVSSRPLWVADQTMAMPSIAIMEWWWGLGQMTVFFLVGLHQISKDLYEAARVDGASELQLIRHITLPMLRPTILTWVILKITVYAVVVEMLVFGGTGDTLMTWARYAWENAFVYGLLNVGYGATVGIIGAVVMCILALVAHRALRSESYA